MPEAIKPTVAALVLTFLFTLSATVAVYTNSNFLAEFFTVEDVALVYPAAALLGLAALAASYRTIRRRGNTRVFYVTLGVTLVGTVMCAIATSPLVAALGFALAFAGGVVGNYQIDIYLESASRNSQTGVTRGWYLTAMNVAYMLGPTIAAIVITDHQFWRVFAVSAVVLVLTAVFVRRRFGAFQDPPYEITRAGDAIRRIWASSDLRRAFASFATLQVFYTWMVIFTPLYLTQTMGFEVHEVAQIAIVALIPFLVLQEWLGKLADCCTGEKEFLTGGLALMGLSTVALAAIGSGSFAVWAGALLVTRIGAAMVESMVYSYIFRRVDAAQGDVMQFFHAARPAATIVAPLLAAPLLLAYGIPALFVALGALCLLTLLYVRPMRDSR